MSIVLTIGVNSATLSLSLWIFRTCSLARNENKGRIEAVEGEDATQRRGGRCGRRSILSFNLLPRAKITVKLNYIYPPPQDPNRETHFFSANFVSFASGNNDWASSVHGHGII